MVGGLAMLQRNDDTYTLTENRMSSYQIKRAPGEVPLTGAVAGTPWAAANVLDINQYAWYKDGKKQNTQVRILYDDRNLYLQFQCEDKHIAAKCTEHNGPVCLDSCVEAFMMIDPANGPHYFNLEINCCGNIHMGYGVERNGRIVMDEKASKRMTIKTSQPTPTKQESPADNGWWVAAKVPLDLISDFSGKKVAPKPGTAWKANFYRCGGETDVQYASWNLIQWHQPDFHRPEFFGDLKFV